MDEVKRMGEKLRDEYNTAAGGNAVSSGQGYYHTSSYSGQRLLNGGGTRCTTTCTQLASFPTFAGKSREELDALTKQWSQSIVSDMQQGRVGQAQILQPEWFEQRAIKELEALSNQHQQQSQIFQNSYSSGQQTNQQTIEQQQQQGFYTTGGGSSNYQREQKERNYEFNAATTAIPMIQGSYYQQHQQQNQFDNSRFIQPQPIQTGSNTYQTSRTIYQQQERRIPIVIPTQRTIVSSSQTEERSSNHQQQQVQIPINIGGGAQHTIEEQSYYRNHSQPRPIIIPVNNQRQHSIYDHVREYSVPSYQPQYIRNEHTAFETAEERERHRQVIPTQPTITTIHRTEESYDSRNQQQRPIRPTVTTTHHVVIEDRNQDNRGVILVPNSHQYVLDVTEEEYETRLRQVQNQLNRLGYTNNVSENQLNATIASGFFIHNGKRYNYNEDTQRYEKEIIGGQTHVHVDLTEEDYRHRMHLIQNLIEHYQFEDLNEEQLNRTLTTGTYVNGEYTWEYNNITRRFERIDANEARLQTYGLTKTEYRHRINQMQHLVTQYHLGELTQREIYETIRTGVFQKGGYKWRFNASTGTFEEIQQYNSQRFNGISEQEYNRRVQQISMLIAQYSLGTFTQSEIDEIVRTGVFVSQDHQYEWRYNENTGNFERFIQYDSAKFGGITETEYRRRIELVRQIINQYHAGSLSESEIDEVIIHGEFVYGNYKFIYDESSGQFTKIVRYDSSKITHISETEYYERANKLIQLLEQYSLGGLSDEEFIQVIATGILIRGDYKWIYNEQTGTYDRQRLYDSSRFNGMSEEEYRYRIEKLLQLIREENMAQLTQEQIDEIIISGYYIYGERKWRYSNEIRDYEEMLANGLSMAEYTERLMKLKELLEAHRVGQLTDAMYNATISAEYFILSGYKWQWNTRIRNYNSIGSIDGNDRNDSTIDFDRNRYTSTADKPKRKPPLISKDRGDQPPQHIEDDYESDEVEEEPGIGPYPARTDPPPPPPPIQPSFQTVTERQHYERIEEYQVVTPAPIQTEYEHRYHKKQTSYTQTGPMV